jgi:hypothetical protein
VTSLRSLGRACVVLFALSTAFPVVAGVLYTGRPPRWLGIADVAVAALLFIAAAALASRGRGAVTDAHRLAALRAAHRVAAIIPALLAAYFVSGPRVDWAVLVVGLAWRGWLLLYTLPVLAASLVAVGPGTTGEDAHMERFGCERCWPASADAAHEARRTLRGEAQLVDESHFRVGIRVCPACAQRFVSVFTETIDWDDGDDPQYWTLMPVTAEEVADLRRHGDDLSESTLNALGPARRCLQHDHPKGVPPRSYWGTGISAGPHD